jgi:hypothetical protein
MTVYCDGVLGVMLSGGVKVVQEYCKLWGLACGTNASFTAWLQSTKHSER